MIKVLFVCHGNICRSPMAEYIFKNKIKQKGLEDRFYAESAATSDEECWNGVGNPVYPSAKKELARHGIGTPGNELGVGGKRARQLRRDDYEKWDLIVGMEARNLSGIRRIVGSDPENKIRLLMDFAGTGEDIADPWYTGDFEGVYDMLERGIEAMIKELCD